MKTKILISVLITLVFALNFQAQTVKRKKTLSKKNQTKSKLKKNKAPKVISLGVINGRAINLVKPEFPLAAKAVGVFGAVNVLILIDENGKVIEAKAVSGHPLLRAGSVSAALESTFQPVTLGGIPVKVQGVIVYKYNSGVYNWLEIGNALGNTTFTEMLPAGFEEVKQIYEQYLTADSENKLPIYQNLRAIIENKLTNNRKNLWLFQVGVFLSKFQVYNSSEEDWKDDIAELETLLSNSPEKISPTLISKIQDLRNLMETIQFEAGKSLFSNKIYRLIYDVRENMPMLGDSR